MCNVELKTNIEARCMHVQGHTGPDAITVQPLKKIAYIICKKTSYTEKKVKNVIVLKLDVFLQKKKMFVPKVRCFDTKLKILVPRIYQ